MEKQNDWNKLDDSISNKYNQTDLKRLDDEIKMLREDFDNSQELKRKNNKRLIRIVIILVILTLGLMLPGCIGLIKAFI